MRANLQRAVAEMVTPIRLSLRPPPAKLPDMIRMGHLFIALVFVVSSAAGTGCESAEEKGKAGAYASSPFGRDLDRICNAEERSGAKAEPEGSRPITVANWLGQSLESQAGRDFLGRLARTAPADKAQLLTSEAAKLGIDPCPLAGAWGGPAAP